MRYEAMIYFQSHRFLKNLAGWVIWATANQVFFGVFRTIVFLRQKESRTFNRNFKSAQNEHFLAALTQKIVPKS